MMHIKNILTVSACSMLFILTGCSSNSAPNPTKQVQNSKLSNTKLSKEVSFSGDADSRTCPASVSVTPKAYGLIVVDWGTYAPQTNTYYTVVVVPHMMGASAINTSDINATGSVTLENFVRGSYTVYYTVHPGSATFSACVGNATVTFT